jgi:DNA polymerase III subunit gamma/tau
VSMNHFVVSARKYRPATFDTVVGQHHITNTLKNAILNNHLAQAFLFCGPRGVGKTTCARILAKTLNCHHRTAEAEACNQCDSCVSFNNGQTLNIYELDAASNNSVDDIRGLVEQVRYAPHSGEYKIYIIDEVHMLSVSAFNAFLKTLEEPPSYAIFILATTEKHKIIPTILSRCQIFDFNRIQLEDIASHLAYVAEKEGVTAEPDALHIIAQKADGALRDALSIFDQMVSFSGNTVTYKDVITNLSILDYDYFFRITDDIRAGNISAVLLTFNELLADGFDGHHFITGLAGHFRDLLVCQDPSTLSLLEVSKNIRDRYKEQAQQTPPALIIRLLDLCSQADVTYKSSRNQRLHVELTLIKMCALQNAALNTSSPAVNTTTAAPVKQNTATPSATKPAAVPPAEKKTINEPKQVVNEPAAKPIAAPAPLPVTEKKATPPIATASADIPTNAPATGYTTSFKKVSLAQATAPKEVIEVVEKKVDLNDLPATAITQDELLRAWTEFAQKEKAAGKHQLYITLTHRKPQLTADNIIELEIVNLSQENLLTEEKQVLMDYLRSNLNNYQLQLKTILVEAPQDETIYTSKEKYQKMIERNPSLDEMRKQLGLELDS